MQAILIPKGKSQSILPLYDTRYSTPCSQPAGCTNNLPNSQARGNVGLFSSLYYLWIKGSEPGIHKHWHTMNGFLELHVNFYVQIYLWTSLGLRTHSFPNNANGVPDPSKSEFESRSFLPGHQLSDPYRLLSGLSLQSFTACLWQQTCD